jgi:hypothetical protein
VTTEGNAVAPAWTIALTFAVGAYLGIAASRHLSKTSCAIVSASDPPKVCMKMTSDIPSGTCSTGSVF